MIKFKHDGINYETGSIIQPLQDNQHFIVHTINELDNLYIVMLLRVYKHNDLYYTGDMEDMVNLYIAKDKISKTIQLV